MHAIKSDMKDVLKSSMDFWKDFANFKNQDFQSFKKNLEVDCCHL
jgi:ribulose 1,5-bisphosphate carboxylase large subunit-like protein